MQFLRAATLAVAPNVQFITETNVPLAENLSYFGEQNEAHMIYNFSLAPVLAHALLSGNVSALRRCFTRLPSAPVGCAYFNFTSSHDGIGLRPAESLLDETEIQKLIDHAHKMGGEVSWRRTQNNELKAYELNVTLASFLQESFDGEHAMGLQRFTLCQGFAMSIEGIPAIYIQAVFAAFNDRAGFEESGIARRLNRKRWSYHEAECQLTSDRAEKRHSSNSRCCCTSGKASPRFIQMPRSTP
ncbi:MAG: hypothetical protein HC848_06965 [Limnobacter sp.]|nr:hypothetical protein [Limnobacter sp.]